MHLENPQACADFTRHLHPSFCIIAIDPAVIRCHYRQQRKLAISPPAAGSLFEARQGTVRLRLMRKRTYDFPAGMIGNDILMNDICLKEV
jgi:hypothetical protein